VGLASVGLASVGLASVARFETVFQAMTYEVENKFPVDEFGDVLGRLGELGLRMDQDPETDQVDFYFGHPSRDFRQTDEALRIRSVGEVNLVTYKGPKLDRRTKTRRELELPLARGAQLAARYCELLAALGFQPVAEVRKRRRGGQLTWERWPVQVALDEVDRLGRFVELEIQAEQHALEAAQRSLLLLAERLGLARVERRSYLEMVLAGA
jgi:adenylate cyclase, class 2